MTDQLSPEIQGRSVLILGYGREGRCVHRWLAAHAPQIRVAVSDEKPVELVPEAAAETVVYSGEDYLSITKEYDTAVRSPGLSPRRIPPRITAHCRMTSLTNIFFSQAPGTIIGITGTKGKSTTSSLLHRLLGAVSADVRLVGNIGFPALDHLAGADENTIFVCELSSFQLEDLRYGPHIAVFLEVFPEHLDHHGGFDDYRAAKLNIARQQKSGDFLVLSRENSVRGLSPAELKARKVFFSAVEPADGAAFVAGGCLCLRRGSGAVQSVLPVADLPLLGPGNVQNALAALAAASLFDVSPADAAAALRSFQPLAHRLEYIGTHRGIRFFNDSLSTIPQAAINALEALAPDVETIILGGHDRGIDYAPLGPEIIRRGVKTAILLPTTGEQIWREVCRAAGGRDRLPQKYDADSLEQAVRIAYRETAPGKICLLSPAASSYNMFRDYQERGDIFRHWVEVLGRGDPGQAAP